MHHLLSTCYPPVTRADNRWPRPPVIACTVGFQQADTPASQTHHARIAWHIQRFSSRILFMLWFLRNAAGGIVRWGTATVLATVCLIYGFAPSKWLASFLIAPPDWISNPLVRVGIVAFGVIVIIVVFLWDRRVRPKFSVNFDNARDVHTDVPLFDLAIGRPLGICATYVHIQISAVRRSNINLCQGWITCLERLDERGRSVVKIEETRQLVWAPREPGHTQVPVHPGAPVI